MIQGRPEEQNIAQGFEQMFIRRRLYHRTITSTGIEVISIAICVKDEMSIVVVKTADELTDRE